MLTALIEDVAGRLRSAIDAIIEDWLVDEVDVGRLFRALANPYRKGYAELAVGLHTAGWRERGEPVFGKVANVLHEARLAQTKGGGAPDIVDTQLAVAAFHQAIALDSLYGEAFRRSAGAKASTAKGSEQQLERWIGTIQSRLDLR